jgi:hypothetical protein
VRKKTSDFIKSGWFAVLLQLLSTERMYCCTLQYDHNRFYWNRFIFAILAASASYIAVPAALEIAVPKANPGLYLQWLAITFPLI